MTPHASRGPDRRIAGRLIAALVALLTLGAVALTASPASAAPAYARGVQASAPAAAPAAALAAGTFVSCSIPIGSSGIVRVTANIEPLFQSGHISTAVAEMNNTTRGIDMITNNVVDANGVLHGQGGQRGPGGSWAWTARDTLKASTHVVVVVRATTNHAIGGGCNFTPYSHSTVPAISLRSALALAA